MSQVNLGTEDKKHECPSENSCKGLFSPVLQTGRQERTSRLVTRGSKNIGRLRRDIVRLKKNITKVKKDIAMRVSGGKKRSNISVGEKVQPFL